MKTKKTKTYFMIVSITLLILLLSSLMIILINRNINIFIQFGQNEVTELEINEIYENTFNLIKIKAHPANIEIKKSEDEKIKVLVYAEKNNANIETDENELYIDVESKKCNFFCFERKISKIELYIPNNYDKDLEIEGTWGKIEINEFLNMNAEIKQTSGNININKVKNIKIDISSGNTRIDTVLENAKIKATSGNIKVGSIQENAELETSSGDIKINSIKNAKIKATSGNIELEKVKEFIDAESSSGNINIKNIDIIKDSKIKATSGNIKIGSSNDIYIDTKTNSGNTTIEKNNRKAEITLQIITSSGNIKVN